MPAPPAVGLLTLGNDEAIVACLVRCDLVAVVARKIHIAFKRLAVRFDDLDGYRTAADLFGRQRLSGAHFDHKGSFVLVAIERTGGDRTYGTAGKSHTAGGLSRRIDREYHGQSHHRKRQQRESGKLSGHILTFW